MTNASFTQTDEQTRVDNLVDVIDKRCRGFIKRDVLKSAVNRLDPRKQMIIDVVNETVFKSQAKTRSVYQFNNGVLGSVQLQWARCLIGSVALGSDIVNMEDGVENIVSTVPTEIITSPAMVVLEEQPLGNFDTSSTRVLIYI